MLSPLTKVTSIKRNSKWTQVEQYAFDEIKGIVVRDTLLTRPGFKETFKTHTNASVFRLRSVISHKVKPIAFYSRKLTGAQMRYTVTEI